MRQIIRFANTKKKTAHHSASVVRSATCLLLALMFYHGRAAADVERWLKWEIERNDLYTNTAIFHQLPDSRSLESLRASSIVQVEVPDGEAKVIASSLATPELKARFVDPETGSIRFYIHPKALDLFPRFKDSRFARAVDVKATTSPRTVFFENLMLKLSLPQRVNGVMRTVYPLQMERALAVSEMLAEIPSHLQRVEGFGYLPEVLGIYDAAPDSPFGFLVRAIPEEILKGKTTLVPLTAYTAQGKNGEPSLMEADARLSGQAAEKHVASKVIPSLIRAFALAARHGVVLEAHQQNTMLELDADGRFTGRIFFRDMDGARVDFEIRRRAGLSTKHLKTVSNASWVFDLDSLSLIANEVSVPSGRPSFWTPLIERAYQEYVLGSSIFLLQKGLERVDRSWWKAWLPRQELAKVADQELAKLDPLSPRIRACSAVFAD